MIQVRRPALRLVLLLLLVGTGPARMLAQTTAQGAEAAAGRLSTRADNSQPKASTTSAKSDFSAQPVVRIASGDLLEITVYGMEDMSQKARVDGDGNISLQLVGQVHVSGLTASEAEKLLAKTSVDKGILKDPHFSVFMKENAESGISVLGEVQKPGIYPLQGGQHLLDVISAAGGTTEKAGRVVTITHRDSPAEMIKVQLPKAEDDPLNNVPIYPGDTVVVAKAGLVYVVGEVGKPSGIIMDNNERMTVLEAIAMAQGTTPNAKLNSAILIRTTAGERKEIPIQLASMLRAKTPDMPLQKDDILFVPTSMGKTIAHQSISSIMQIAVGAAIYRP